MSNYVKATNFAVKDTLSSGDTNKVVRGTEIDTEFTAIASAIASKANTASPTFTGTPLAPTASTATENTQIATTAYVANKIGAIAAGVTSFSAGSTGLTPSTGTTGNVTLAGTLGIGNGGTNATTTAGARTSLNVPTRTGGDASGTWGISITGNAATSTQLSTASGSAPSYSARAWVNFNGTGTVAIRASGNVSSITDNGVGDYTINFSTAMPDTNYAVVSSNPSYATATAAGGVYVGPKFPSLLPDSQASLATGSVRIATTAGGRANANAFQTDPDSVCVSILR